MNSVWKSSTESGDNKIKNINGTKLEHFLFKSFNKQNQSYKNKTKADLCEFQFIDNIDKEGN